MNLLAVIISGCSLCVAMIALDHAKQSNKKANDIASENVNLQHGQLENEIRQSIENSKMNITNIVITMAPLKAKESIGNISDEDKKTLDIYTSSSDSAIQTMLNIYDDACAKYIDNRVDKGRFKKNFYVEIRNLLQEEEMNKYFHPNTSNYKAIMRVYDEWENLEK
ncbi:hypothetical protein [Psychromonas aquimarina]|uniref:hypothetical protein n=1 Tax=Psychromonas aquimarina TaxID=444919 RepID=UPI0003F7B8FE|nr:hypothetical protein [Psychromonas aquimarina]